MRRSPLVWWVSVSFLHGSGCNNGEGNWYEVSAILKHEVMDARRNVTYERLGWNDETANLGKYVKCIINFLREWTNFGWDPASGRVSREWHVLTLVNSTMFSKLWNYKWIVVFAKKRTQGVCHVIIKAWLFSTAWLSRIDLSGLQNGLVIVGDVDYTGIRGMYFSEHSWKSTTKQMCTGKAKERWSSNLKRGILLGTMWMTPPNSPLP